MGGKHLDGSLEGEKERVLLSPPVPGPLDSSPKWLGGRRRNGKVSPPSRMPSSSGSSLKLGSI